MPSLWILLLSNFWIFGYFVSISKLIAIQNMDSSVRKDYVCVICRYEWKSRKEPKRCSNTTCRSMKWRGEPIQAPLVTEEWSPVKVCKRIQDTFPQHIKDMHPEWDEKKKDLDSLKNLISSIPVRRESPIETPKVEQYDLSEPSIHYD